MPKKMDVNSENIATEEQAAIKPTAKRTAPRTPKRTEAKAEIDTPAAVMDASVAMEDDKAKEPIRLKELTPNTFVTVRNGFAGKLIYHSRRTGENITWEQFDSEQEMELQELRNAKNTSRDYFEKNWFIFDDPEVVQYLGVERYYRNALDTNGMDNLFALNPEEIEDRVHKLSSSQKATVAYIARKKIADGEIDSLKVISALERGLGKNLIER